MFNDDRNNLLFNDNEVLYLPDAGEPVDDDHVERKHEEEEGEAGLEEPVQGPGHPTQPEQPHQLNISP